MKSLLLGLLSLTALTANAKFTGYVCDYADASMKNSPLIIQMAAGGSSTANVFQVSYYGTQGLDVDGDVLRGNSMGSFDVSSQGQTMQMSATFGSRIALTGYYGQRTISMDRSTGMASLTVHEVPHLIADINAPRAESTTKSDLKCTAKGMK